jgi:hypothetical protein
MVNYLVSIVWQVANKFDPSSLSTTKVLFNLKLDIPFNIFDSMRSDTPSTHVSYWHIITPLVDVNAVKTYVLPTFEFTSLFELRFAFINYHSQRLGEECPSCKWRITPASLYQSLNNITLVLLACKATNVNILFQSIIQINKVHSL